MKSILIFCALLAAGSGLGCNRESEPGPPQIALVTKTLNNPFFIEMQRGAREAADRLGVELIVQAPERELDVEKQVQIVEDLIQRRVGALCLTPSGSREVIPAIAKANQAGIPVLIIDSRVDEAALGEHQTQTYIGSDNYDGGRLAGLHVVQWMKGGARVAILEGIAGHEAGDDRLRGFRDAIADADNVEVVSSQPANFERDQGFNVFQNVLEAHPEINTLFACNDLMALGALEAIDAAGRRGQIRVIGFDAVPEARKAIAEGRMMASVAQNPAEMGRLAVENALKILQGQTIEQTIPVPIELITASNVGQ